MITRPVALTGLGGALLAAIGVVGVAAGSPPHLGLDRIDPWLIAFGVGLAVLFGALAFGFHDVASRRTEDAENRWERALGMWGAAAAAAAVLFALLGLAAGFDPASASGALAIVALFECLLIVAALVALVLGS